MPCLLGDPPRLFFIHSTYSIALSANQMTEPSKVSKANPVTIPQAITRSCAESECLEKLVRAIQSSQTVYQQMNCFGVYKEEIRPRAWWTLISSCNKRQRAVPVHLLPSHPPILSELEEERVVHGYNMRGEFRRSNGVEQTFSG